MVKKMHQVLKIIVGLYILCSVGVAYAVKPSSAYQQEIYNSEIKAVAVVKKVQITNWELGHQTKKVWFETIKALNKTTSSEFTGYCMSFKNKWPWENKEVPEGGYIFHYPKKGEHVVVTVSEDNGIINSFSVISKAKENELIKSGLNGMQLTPISIKNKGMLKHE